MDHNKRINENLLGDVAKEMFGSDEVGLHYDGLRVEYIGLTWYVLTRCIRAECCRNTSTGPSTAKRSRRRRPCASGGAALVSCTWQGMSYRQIGVAIGIQGTHL